MTKLAFLVIESLIAPTCSVEQTCVVAETEFLLRHFLLDVLYSMHETVAMGFLVFSAQSSYHEGIH